MENKRTRRRPGPGRLRTKAGEYHFSIMKARAIMLLRPSQQRVEEAIAVAVDARYGSGAHQQPEHAALVQRLRTDLYDALGLQEAAFELEALESA